MMQRIEEMFFLFYTKYDPKAWIHSENKYEANKPESYISTSTKRSITKLKKENVHPVTFNTINLIDLIHPFIYLI